MRLYITYSFYGGAIIFIISNIINFRAIKNATSFTTRSIFSGYTTFTAFYIKNNYYRYDYYL